MTIRGMRFTGVIAAGGALCALAGCAPVEGSGSADPSDVAAYQTVLASSRAAAAASQLAAAAAAKTTACTAWRSGYDTRNAVSDATVKVTKGSWNWDSIGPTIGAELAAIATETGRLPGIIATPNLPDSVKAVMTDYKGKLDAYAGALRADQAARGVEGQTWPKTNPAIDALDKVANNLKGLCSTS